eukprot:7745063-Alexandrium_andersonii.AAC.1
MLLADIASCALAEGVRLQERLVARGGALGHGHQLAPLRQLECAGGRRSAVGALGSRRPAAPLHLRAPLLLLRPQSAERSARLAAHRRNLNYDLSETGWAARVPL